MALSLPMTAWYRPHCAAITGALCCAVWANGEPPPHNLVPESFASTHGWLDHTLHRVRGGLLAPERLLLLPQGTAMTMMNAEGDSGATGPDGEPEQDGNDGGQYAEPGSGVTAVPSEGREASEGDDDDALRDRVVATDAQPPGSHVEDDREQDQMDPQAGDKHSDTNV